MKNTKKLFITILILFFCLIQSSDVFAQNKYSNEAISLYNEGIALHKQNQYELAEQKYIRALQLEPNFTEAKKNLTIAYQNLAIKYCNNSEYEKSILAYKKILSKDSENNSAMHSLAQVYIKANQFDQASALYQKLLLINPDDKIAQNNLEYVNFQNLEKNLSDSINNINTAHTAPEKLYRLIKPSSNLPPETIENMKTILDLIWSEPNGQIMLQTLMQKKVPINITQEHFKANAKNINQKRTLYYCGIIPIFSWTTSSTSVNIPIEHITNFNNPNLPAYLRIYNLQVFIHEFGHAFMFANNPKNVVSIEEELGVSMLGYNIAYKAITGEYLNKSQTEIYSKGCLESLLSDQHRELKVYNNFNRDIQSYGIALPYPEVYTDIVAMYKKLLLQKKTTPVPSFDYYML